MRFKTTINIVSDANNKNEALELVEEYLAGNIVSGVDMRCATRPVCSNAKIIGVAALSLAIVAGLVLGSYIKHPQSILRVIPGISAVQPPLKTSATSQDSPKFKKEWQDRQMKEALEYIKQ